MSSSKDKDSIYLKSSRVRNTLPGTEGTYHDAVSSIDLCGLDTFAERVGRKCGYPAAVVKNIIGADGAEAQEILSTRLYRIGDVFGLTLEAAISGSVPSLDSPLTEDNDVYVAIHPSSELKNAASGITPVRSGAETVVALDRVEDEASGTPSVIDGTKTFILTGWGLSTSGEGEGVSVKSMVNGTETSATVIRNDGGRSVWARLDAALPAGKAKVCVMTGGAEPGELWPVSRTVTILAGDTPPAPVVPAPTIDAAGTQGCEPGTVEAPGGVVEVTGSNLDTATSIDLLVGEDGTPVEDMELWQTLAATYDAEGGVLATNGVIEDSAPQGFGAVRVTTAGGSATYPVQYTVH